MTEDHEIPADLHRAARDYLDDVSRDVDPECCLRRLIAAFGDLSQRSNPHRHAAWLCLLAAQRALSWPNRPFRADATDHHGTLDVLEQWIIAGVSPSSWDRICNRAGTVRQVGELADDDDTIACMVCALARFSLHHGIPDAVDTLVNAWLLDREEARVERNLMPFETWLISTALPAACQLRVLSTAELHPRSDP